MLCACHRQTTVLNKINLGPWGELPMDGFPQEVPDEGPRLLVYDLEINMLTGPWSKEDRLMVGMSITWRGAGSGACSDKHPFVDQQRCPGSGRVLCYAARWRLQRVMVCEAWLQASNLSC